MGSHGPERASRILIADSQAVIRSGVRLALDEHEDLRVVAEACDLRSAFEAVEAARPDVAVVELELHEGSPAEMIRRFGERPDIALVLLARSNEPGPIEEALALGVRAILSKNAPVTNLVAAIRGVRQARGWMPPQLEARLAAEAGQAAAWACLTSRERDVAGLVSKGFAYRQVAEMLAISDHTVKNHLRRIYDKLDINSRVELAVYGVRGAE